jgi:hypothetical protein
MSCQLGVILGGVGHHPSTAFHFRVLRERLVDAWTRAVGFPPDVPVAWHPLFPRDMPDHWQLFDTYTVAHALGVQKHLVCYLSQGRSLIWWCLLH